MAYAAKATDGTVVSIYITSAYVPIPGVDSFALSGGGKVEIPTTALDDTAAKSVGGKPNFGTAQMTIFWDPGENTHARLYSSYITANSTDSLQVTMTDTGAATVTINGYVQNFEMQWNRDAPNQAVVTFKPSGLPTLTP